MCQKIFLRLILYQTWIMLFNFSAFATSPLLSHPQGTLAQPKASASFLGTHQYERIGYWLSTGGDINGDGKDDFLIGTFHNEVNGYEAGAVYLILGRSNSQWRMDKPLEQADARFLGKGPYRAVGYSVSGGGDINGDGLDDFVIGAPAGNDDGRPRPGSVFFMFGRRTANWGNACIPDDAADASFLGEIDRDQLGKSVAIVGDLNNDGYDDVVVGAPFNDQSNPDGGKVYIVLGRSYDWGLDVNIRHSDASFYSRVINDRAGYVVAGAGDVNHDGLDDFLIGAHGAGNAYLIFGRKNADWGHNNNLAYANVHFEAENKYDDAGWIVAGAGDVNRDGYDDVLVTSAANADGGSEAGKVYLIFGRRTWPSLINLGSADASFIGEASRDNAGWSADGVGDINDDGYDDFMIGAWYNDQGGSDAGKAYIIFGKSSGWQRNVDLATVADYILGETRVNYMGFAVAAAGDVNRGGIPDFIVSAPYSNEAHEWGGQVYLFLGERLQTPISGKVTYYDNQQPIPAVQITRTGSVMENTQTDDQGNYRIRTHDASEVVLSASKGKGTDQDLLSILSYDAALIAQHVTSANPLNTEQKRAADVDLDQEITSYDAALIARHVVELEPPAASHVAEWLFNPAERTHTNVVDSLPDQDFTGYILGNVHGGWQPPGQLTRLPLAKNTFWRNPQLITNSGTTIKIPIPLPTDTEIYALDIHLKYESEHLHFEEIIKNSLFQNFTLTYNDQPGILKISLFSAVPICNPPNGLEVLFSSKTATKTSATIVLEKIIINDQLYESLTTAIELTPQAEIPDVFKLEPNYPNPFNPETTIRYQIPCPALVEIKIYNLSGQEICTLVNRVHQPGHYSIKWDGKTAAGQEVASGIYICRARLGSQVIYQRMVKIM